MRKNIDRDLTRLAQDFSVGVHPERNGAADRETPASVGEQAFKAQMISVIRSREDPEEVHAAEVICAEKIQKAVAVDRIGAEFEAASLITGVHDHCEESPGAVGIFTVAGDLHSDHRAREDHVNRLRDIDQLSHADHAQNRFKKGAVSPLADRCVESDPGADVEQSYIIRLAGIRRGVLKGMISGFIGDRFMREGIQHGGAVVVSEAADIAGADSLTLYNGRDELFAAFLYSEPFDEVVSGSGLDKSYLCLFEIPDAVYDGVHRSVSAKNNDPAFFTAGSEIFTDIFYPVMRGGKIDFIRSSAVPEKGLYLVPLALAAA